MENNQLSIILLADDFSAEEFNSVLRDHFPESEASVQVTTINKTGRADNSLIELFFSSGLAINLLASMIYDLVKFGFSKLTRVFGSKPAAVITLVDDSQIILPNTLSDSEIQNRILEAVQKTRVKSIQFDS